MLAGALTSQILQVNDIVDRLSSADFFGNDEALMVVTQWLEVERYLEKRPLWKLLSVGTGRAECASNRAADRISMRRPISTGSIWLPSCGAISLRIVAV